MSDELTRLLQLALVDGSDKVKQELCRSLLRQGFNMDLFESDYYKLRHNNFTITLNFEINQFKIQSCGHLTILCPIQDLFDLQTLLEIPDLLTLEIDKLSELYVTRLGNWEIRRNIDFRTKSKKASYIIEMFDTQHDASRTLVWFTDSKIFYSLQKIVSDACNILFYRKEEKNENIPV